MSGSLNGRYVHCFSELELLRPRYYFWCVKNNRTFAFPTYVVQDEVDAIATTRSEHSGESSTGDRVLTTLLTEMDGVEPLQGVMILAATNRPSAIVRYTDRPSKELLIASSGPSLAATWSLGPNSIYRTARSFLPRSHLPGQLWQDGDRRRRRCRKAG